MYAEKFSGGNVDKAKALLWRRQNDEWDWDILHIGVFVGMSIPLIALLALFLIGGTIDAFAAQTVDDANNVLPVYRLVFG